MATVDRLVANVTLDDPAPAMERAQARAAAGDEDWERWVAEYRRGEALIVRLAVKLEVTDGEQYVIEIQNREVFLETDSQPPKVEQQIAELVSKDFSTLERELATRGHDIDDGELHEMFVHVELGEDVRQLLKGSGSRSDGPASDARLSRQEGPASDRA